MGADLYIQPGFDNTRKAIEPVFQMAVTIRDRLPEDSPLREAAQLGVANVWDLMYGSGNPFYYRDCYNPASTLAHFGLSWWTDVIPMLQETDDGPNLMPTECLALADMIEQAEYVGGSATAESVFTRAASAVAIRMAEEEDGPVTIAEPAMGGRAWYEANRTVLVDFLRRGAANGIRASL